MSRKLIAATYDALPASDDARSNMRHGYLPRQALIDLLSSDIVGYAGVHTDFGPLEVDRRELAKKVADHHDLAAKFAEKHGRELLVNVSISRCDYKKYAKWHVYLSYFGYVDDEGKSRRVTWG